MGDLSKMIDYEVVWSIRPESKGQMVASGIPFVTTQDCTKRDRGISHVYNDIGEHVRPQRSVCDLCQL